MIEPIGDMVLVEQLIEPSKTESGLHLPEGAGDKTTNRFFVIAKGRGTTPSKQQMLKDIDVKDIVIAQSFGGVDAHWKSRKFRLIDVSAILAKVSE